MAAKELVGPRGFEKHVIQAFYHQANQGLCLQYFLVRLECVLELGVELFIQGNLLLYLLDCDKETLEYRATRACRGNPDDNLNLVGSLMG